MRRPDSRVAPPAAVVVVAAVAGLVLAGCGQAARAVQRPGALAAAPPGAAPVRLALAAGTATAPFDVPRSVTVPPGWTAQVWARVDGARMAVWTPVGDLLVSRPGAGEVVRLRPSADRAAAPAATTLLSGLRQPHGLALAGTTLYVAESNQVDRVPLRADGSAAPASVLLGGLPDSKSPELGGQYAHALKSVAVGRDGTVYVSVGSTGNTSEADLTASPPRAAVLAVNPDGTGLRSFATGVRNGEGLALDPDGALWAAVNNRDNTAYPWHRDYDRDGTEDFGKVMQPYVDDHPAEPLAKLTPGRDLGWPYCNPDPDVSPGTRGSTFSYASPPFVRDVQLNADGAKRDCAALAPVERGLPAHSAPLGLSFLTGTPVPSPWREGAVVGVHGSWNRATPREPEVAWFPWDAARHTLGEQVTVLGGFQDGTGDRFGRPVDAVAGPDGALYVTDDKAGAIYRLVAPAGPGPAGPAGTGTVGTGAGEPVALDGAAPRPLLRMLAGRPPPRGSWGISLSGRPGQHVSLVATATWLTGSCGRASVATQRLSAGCARRSTRATTTLVLPASGRTRVALPIRLAATATAWGTSVSSTSTLNSQRLRLTVRSGPRFPSLHR